ncbi:ribulose-5-phosphate 4-epimerase [Klebsiella variicola]|uniref:Ribulose-5-phosphate 4-epimerase n=1 Tax=Klebsiella variicola TaxID=244366 RepID=A0A7H4MJR0_KLEVA|nr:ribulose-5-phosphate 4-epimerase [Klebsiella variicola]
MTLQGEWISGDKPSKEVTFHRAVYLHNPACKAIVHLHSHYLTALSCLQGARSAQLYSSLYPLMW